MKNFKLKLKNRLQNKGFAMLFSVLTSSLVLSIGLSIFNLTLKELALSSIGRESQFAFYAADSGAECAMYWDFKGADIFATSTDGRTPLPAGPTCNSGAINIVPTTATKVDDLNSTASTQFQMNIDNPDSAGNPYCAIVTVIKTNTAGFSTTKIDSRGYNTCATTDPGRVERALRIQY